MRHHARLLMAGLHSKHATESRFRDRKRASDQNSLQQAHESGSLCARPRKACYHSAAELLSLDRQVVDENSGPPRIPLSKTLTFAGPLAALRFLGSPAYQWKTIGPCVGIAYKSCSDPLGYLLLPDNTQLTLTTSSETYAHLVSNTTKRGPFRRAGLQSVVLPQGAMDARMLMIDVCNQQPCKWLGVGAEAGTVTSKGRGI